MKQVTVYITHHKSGNDERTYAQVFQPSGDRIKSLREQGYEVFRATVTLPIDDPTVPIEEVTAEVVP